MIQSIGQDTETGTIVLCAVRYCIGRRTYTPQLVIDWCKRHWGELPENDRWVIQRDIEEEILRADRGMTRLGDSCDSIAWREFSEWIKAQEGAAS